MKLPDLALDFGAFAVVVEVDEQQRDEVSCWDEDTRLAVIAADFQKHIAVIRARADTPVACFRRKRLNNGEPTWVAVEGPLALLMTRVESALRELAQRQLAMDNGGQLVITAASRVVLDSTQGCVAEIGKLVAELWRDSV